MSISQGWFNKSLLQPSHYTFAKRSIMTRMKMLPMWRREYSVRSLFIHIWTNGSMEKIFYGSWLSLAFSLLSLVHLILYILLFERFYGLFITAYKLGWVGFDPVRYTSFFRSDGLINCYLNQTSLPLSCVFEHLNMLSTVWIYICWSQILGEASFFRVDEESDAFYD